MKPHLHLHVQTQATTPISITSTCPYHTPTFLLCPALHLYPHIALTTQPTLHYTYSPTSTPALARTSTQTQATTCTPITLPTRPTLPYTYHLTGPYPTPICQPYTHLPTLSCTTHLLLHTRTPTPTRSPTQTQTTKPTPIPARHILLQLHLQGWGGGTVKWGGKWGTVRGGEGW